MKKVIPHIIGIMTAAFIIFTLGLFIGRLQLPNETIPEKPDALYNEQTEAIVDKVNINTASIDELLTLPGVGYATAEAIIEYRTTNGPIESIEQLIDIKGIGYKKFEDLVDLICLE